jgi:hypothetical protein
MKNKAPNSGVRRQNPERAKRYFFYFMNPQKDVREAEKAKCRAKNAPGMKENN